MTKLNDLHKKWMKNKEYRKAHEELAPEFAHGKRPHPAIHANSGTCRGSNENTPHDYLRAGARAPVKGVSGARR
jgi:hypothetical protein